MIYLLITETEKAVFRQPLAGMAQFPKNMVEELLWQEKRKNLFGDGAL
jgi:hypothetical protein